MSLVNGQGRGSYDAGAFVQTYTGIFMADGQDKTYGQVQLAASTYTVPSGYTYRTGALLAWTDGTMTEVTNCDPASGTPEITIPIGILAQDDLPSADELGAPIVGFITWVVTGAFTVKATDLFATAAGGTDVAAAMANWDGVRYDSVHQTYVVGR